MAIIKLCDIGEFKGGISSLNKKKYDTGINFINYMDIYKNYFINDNTKLRKYNASHKEYEKYNVIYGDILLTASSEIPEEISFSTVYLSNKPAIFNGFSKRYRYNKNILQPKFAGYIFRSKIFRTQVKSLVTGYTRFNISQKDLKTIELNIPSLDVQKSIIDIIEPLENLKNQFENINKIFINIISKFGCLVINKHGEKIKYAKQSENTNKSGLYVQTSNIGNFDNKIKNKVFYSRLPSRAKLVFANDILYISKLDGEKKFLYRMNYNENFVISNGMWGITAKEEQKYILFAFLLSDFFYKLKNMQSIGTTMQGINDGILNSIINKFNFSFDLNIVLKKIFLGLAQTTIIIEKMSACIAKVINLLV